MNRRTFIKQSAGVATGALAHTALSAPAEERPPNVVYIMADELGYYELSCMGHPYIKTPNIDRLAANGLRFTQALAGSAVCAPTRCCLMTGKHSGHSSVRVNGGGTPLRADEETVASVLKQVGYATGGFGKWGCGGRGSTGVPEKHGFDVFFGYYDQVHAHSYYPPYLVRNSEEIPLRNNRGRSDGETYSHYEIMREGMQFIRDNHEQPFFCYFPVTPPHGIFDIPDSDPAWDVYKDEEWPEQAKRYAAMVTMLDRQVGAVEALLRRLGVADNTIVFFCGDNGGNDYFRGEDAPRGFHGPNVDPVGGRQFRGTKGTLYEGGLRIPMIACWPGRIEPGRVSDHLCYFPDILPTLAELAGATPPDDIDGISIVPTLLGVEAAGRSQAQHDYLYWELGRQTAVRKGHWKLVRRRAEQPWELYDLSTDIEEANNLAATHPDRVAALAALATAAHVPAVEGTFADTALHQRDRAAKFGGKAPARRPAGKPAHTLPREGLVPAGQCTVVRSSSESAFNGKHAANAVDGDAATLWHTHWQGKVATHPHELVLDLGETRRVRGIRYLARQDNGWNGTVKDFEIAVADTPDGFGTPCLKGTFRKTKAPQEATCEGVRGRYLLFRALSEVNGGAWASAAEIGVVAE